MIMLLSRRQWGGGGGGILHLRRDICRKFYASDGEEENFIKEGFDCGCDTLILLKLSKAKRWETHSWMELNTALQSKNLMKFNSGEKLRFLFLDVKPQISPAYPSGKTF